MKPLNWKILGRVMYAYLVTASTLAFFYFLVNLMQAYVAIMNAVLQQPETFFTNKMLFLLFVIFAAGGLAIYFVTTITAGLGTKAWELLKDLFRPWRCQYGGRACEVGKKGIDRPRFFCTRHFMERLEVRVAMAHAEPKRRKR